MTIKKTVTLKDVARAAGIAKSTASMALSGHIAIKQETREAVLRAARDLGFEADLNAQRLGGRMNNNIGLCALYLDLSVMTRMLSLIQARLRDAGYDAPIHAYGCFSPEKPVDQAHLLADLRRQKPRAIICATAGVNKDSYAELLRYHESGGLLVAYGGEEMYLPCDQVIFDARPNTAMAVRHLLELGHRQIGFCEHFIEPPARLTGRMLGVLDAMKEYGVAFNDDWYFYGELYEKNGAQLAQRFLALADRPTGIAIVNDQSAGAFINAVRRAGLRVPEDVSVVGHDDDPGAPHAAVPLTTVSNPVEQMAALVFDLAMSRLEGHYLGPPRIERLTGELIVRESTAPLREEAI